MDETLVETLVAEGLAPPSALRTSGYRTRREELGPEMIADTGFMGTTQRHPGDCLADYLPESPCTNR
jgi:hypothetical protein